jgi:hypothetical protein
MTSTRLLLTTFAAVAVLVTVSQDLRADKIEKPLPPSLTDLSQPQVIEIRNDAGATVLRGTFMTKEDKPKKVERETKLAGISGAGSAEIEVKRENGQIKDQELELELSRLLYDGAYKIYVDSKEVFAFNADGHGKANVKLSTKAK